MAFYSINSSVKLKHHPMKFPGSIVLLVALTYFSEIAIAQMVGKKGKKISQILPQTTTEVQLTAVGRAIPQLNEAPMGSSQTAPKLAPKPAPPAPPQPSAASTVRASTMPPKTTPNSLPKAEAKKEAGSAGDKKQVETNSTTDADSLELIEVDREETPDKTVSVNRGFKGFTLTMSGMAIALFLL